MTSEPRCPSCGALVRPGSAWCSLCHADLRPSDRRADAPSVSTLDARVTDEPAADEPADAPGADDAVRRGRHARPARPQPLTAVPTTVVPTTVVPTTVVPTTVVPTTVVPTTAVRSEVDLALAEAGVDVETMLQMLASDEGRPLSSVADRLSDRHQRVVAVVAATGALMALGLVVMFVLGTVLG